jgi:hypothetical protein
MAARNTIFTTIRTEGALLPADLLQRISEGATLEGLTPESYHRPGEKLNEAINRSWNALQGAWASFRAAQERLPTSDLGTSITRERWLLPLFRELEYGRLQTATAVEINGRSYPISHSWEHVPVHLVSYKLELDKRTPGAAGASSASPHSLLQVFLNRSEGSLWGFVSNGYKLRILRDNASLTRQAYVEFDLEAMMDGEVYSDFVLLWLLCHQSRVEGERPADCWLEKWMKIAEDQGTRALDQLRDSVREAIEALGVGFLEYPANHALRDKLTSGSLNAQEYYRQLLRMVYRLLFLFVAEDRDLLLNPDAPQEARERYSHYYSTQRLRRMAETFTGTRHPDLFEGLRLVMRLLSGNDSPLPQGEGPGVRVEGVRAGAGLGLVPLGSFLFSDRAVADIIDCQISNRRLLTAVRALALTYDQRAEVYRTVDYRNLGSDELGSVFESLLELHPQINVPARQFALATAAGNERKTTGSYYTPESLVHALLDSALDPVLEAAIKGSSTLTPEQRILALKVCDPACGSGHFLIAAANRMAKALAFVRTGEEEPSPAAIQQAKRDVISHCIYGVDINPMAVELCKVNLWMEALEPGKPLNFLDHRILVGNSLLGATPKLMADGIPDDAFTPIEGDDPKYAAEMKKRNKQERKDRASGQRNMFEMIEPPADYSRLTEAMHALDATPDDTLDAVQRKEAQYAALASDPEYIKARLLADAWCAAFVWEKRPTSPPMTDLLYRRMEQDPLAETLQAVRETVVALKERYQFFHWHVAFPDVFSADPHSPDPSLPQGERGANRAESPFSLLPKAPAGWEDEDITPQTGWRGGFDVVLGNPPWERIKIQEKEWFAERAPEIANARNAAARRRAIAELEQSDPHLLQAFAADKRKAEGESHFVRVSGRYPLCGRGDVNTYTIFAETARHILNGHGRVGLIVPSGIATDDTTKYFFQDLMQTRSLASLYDFENREGLFPAVDSRMKFCLLTMRGNPHPPTPSPTLRGPSAAGRRGAAQQTLSLMERGEGDPEFAFFLHSVADLDDPERRFTLSAEDIALINPNTRTVATFRHRRDAEITKAIYRRVPVLIREPSSQTLLSQGEPSSPSPFSLREKGGGAAAPPLAAEGPRRLDEESGVRVNSPLHAAEGPRRVGEGSGVRVEGVRVSNLNPWGISFLRMFDMSNDSHLFHTREELEAAGYALRGNRFVGAPDPSSQTLLPEGEPSSPNPFSLREKGGGAAAPPPAAEGSNRVKEGSGVSASSPLHAAEGPRRVGEGPGVRVDGARVYLPLYEAKLMHQFTHRWATYTSPLHEGEGPGVRVEVRDFTPAELRDPHALAMPRYWVDAQEVAERLNAWDRGWLLGFRDITNTTNERTAIFGLIPRVAVGHVMPLVYFSELRRTMLCLLANFNAFTLDYCARQKVGGTHLTYGYLKQLPVIPPHTYTPALLAFIAPRVLELAYTAWDMQPFARDLGYDGPPFVWDEARRFLIRCELDALYFHLYQIPRDDVDYILETFPIVKRKDEAATADSTHPFIQWQRGARASSPLPAAEGPRRVGEGSGVSANSPLHEGEGPGVRVNSPLHEGERSGVRATPPLHEGERSGVSANPPLPEGEGPGVRAKGVRVKEGEYITKRVILEMYDQMAALPVMHVPAPKSPPLPEGEGSGVRAERPGDEGHPPSPLGRGAGGEGLYAVPDVRQWVTWLEPPPADPRAAHRELP